MKTKILIEQHFHGAFGIDFNKASVEDVLFLSKEILKYGIGGIFPTIVTDSLENTRNAISVIKEAESKQSDGMAKILGIHLEGIFLNPEKKGIHNPEHFMLPTIENYKLIEDDFIKIVTLAPELTQKKACHCALDAQSHIQKIADNFSKISAMTDDILNYLHSKNIKVQAGHCVGGDLAGCDGVTHMFNAMSGITHRGKSTALSALVNDDIYTEVIADGVHVSDDALKLLFKSKPEDKILLISDCLPCTGINTLPLREGRNLFDFGKGSSIEFVFADEKVYYDGIKATSKDGTLAGSTTLLPQIIKRLHNAGLFNPQFIENSYNYHNIDLKGSVEWDDDFNIAAVHI